VALFNQGGKDRSIRIDKEKAKKILETIDEISEIATNRTKWAQLGVQGETAAEAALIEENYLILAKQLYVRTKLGLRITDYVVTDALNPGPIYGFEVKVNGSGYLPTQFAKDQLIATTGGKVVSRFNKIFNVSSVFKYGQTIQYQTYLMNVEIKN
jgi:hypothetical protein